jgi:hypothetical protein
MYQKNPMFAYKTLILLKGLMQFSLFFNYMELKDYWSVVRTIWPMRQRKHFFASQ